MNLTPDKKIAGVLAPLFALRREDDLGIGDLESLRQFIDWSSDIGFRVVQLLPINETGGDNSPYNAISSVAIDPTTLHLAPGSPDELTREDFDAEVAHVDLAKLRHGAVKYRAVKKLKGALLERAFRNFAAQDRQSKFAKFCEAEKSWLDDYTRFRALMEENGTEAWDKWKTRDIAQDRQSHFAERRKFFAYVQWIAHEQWRDVRRYANERGVALMGDIPFGVSLYSADVFSRPNDFRLDWCGGAPPEPYFKDDEFTIKWGQNWGIPLYNWEAMRANNLAWWRQRVRGVREIFDVFRIDHVLGFFRIYAFPWRPSRNKEFLPLTREEMLEKTGGRAPHFSPRDDSTPENCAANQREGEEYLRVVLDESGETRVAGEDLGTVPEYVRPSLRSLGIAGFKIPQWEERHGYLPSGGAYDRLSVATYATHDHKPVRELWEEASTSEQARHDLNQMARFAGFEAQGQPVDYEKDFYPAIMRALFESNSWIAIVMLTDLLARKYRFNVPGTAGAGNWTRRMQRTISQLRASKTEQRRMGIIRDLLAKSGRV